MHPVTRQLIQARAEHGDAAVVDARLSKVETLQIAQEIAAFHARDSRAFELGARILWHCKDVYRDGPVEIARWIRANVRYMMEPPDTEVLRGPWDTLRHRLGDCDDLAILWCTLCRAVGIDAYVAGIGRSLDASDTVHAMGAVPSSGLLVELVEAPHYGFPIGPVVATVPTGHHAMIWQGDRVRPMTGKIAASPGPSLWPFFAAGAAFILWRL